MVVSGTGLASKRPFSANGTLPIAFWPDIPAEQLYDLAPKIGVVEGRISSLEPEFPEFCFSRYKMTTCFVHYKAGGKEMASFLGVKGSIPTVHTAAV